MDMVKFIKAARLTNSAALICAMLAMVYPVQAQGPSTGAVTTAAPTYGNGQTRPLSLDTAGNLRVNASVSASIGGFEPVTTGTPIPVTTGGNTGTLPAGTLVAAFNTGTTNDAYCQLGASATTSDILIPPKSWFAFTVGAATQLTCITATSTTTVNMVGGSGLPTGANGSLSSVAVTQGTSPWIVGQSSAGNLNATVVGTGTFAVQAAATEADGANVTIGAIADAAATQGSTGTVSAKLRTITAQLNTIATNQATLPAGTNTIGTVGQLPYPVGATPITASATGTTAATAATLAKASSVTTYICGFSIRANATAAATGNSTVVGTITATLNFTQWTAPLASGIGITEMVFSPCVPSSTTNTDIVVTSAAPGSGGVVSVSAWGYRL